MDSLGIICRLMFSDGSERFRGENFKRECHIFRHLLLTLFINKSPSHWIKSGIMQHISIKKRWPSLINQVCRPPSLHRYKVDKATSLAYKLLNPPWTCCCRGLPSLPRLFIDPSFPLHLLSTVQGCDQEHKECTDCSSLLEFPQTLRSWKPQYKSSASTLFTASSLCAVSRALW